MKIEKIILENFAAVKTAMNTNKLIIDFTTSKNKICLLIGDNGSGKTTCLSMFHPFADLGNLDSRNGMKLILADKDGYKEITIRKNKDIYLIKHFYTAHKDKSHSVKSYISLNGKELNENGNVTSFKEIVKEELQIESEYLKLIRLGSNVTSLIDLTSTERKTFMGKIMSDIGIFLDHYKAVNLKLRQLDEMISHTIDKINKLTITDKKQYEDELKNKKKELEKIKKTYISLNNELAIIKDRLSKVDDIEALPFNLKSTEKRYNKMLSVMERKNEIENLDIDFYKDKIKEIEKEIDIDGNTYKSVCLLIDNSLTFLDNTKNQYRTLYIQYKKLEESNIEILRMEDNLKELRLKLRQYEDNLSDYDAPYSKDEFDEFVIFLKNTQITLNRIYEFGKKVIEKVVSLLKENKNVMNYINSHIVNIDEERGDHVDVLLHTLAFRYKINPVELLKPDAEIIIGCDKECKAKEMFKEIALLLNDSQVKDKTKDIDFYKDMEIVYKNLMSILPNFANYKELIDVLPDDIKKSLSIDGIYDSISKCKPIYDEKKINELLSYATEFDNYIKFKEEYDKQEKLLDKFSSMSNIKEVKSQLNDLSDTIKETEEKIREYKNDNSKLLEKDVELKNTLEVYKEILDTLENFNEIKDRYENLLKDDELVKELNKEIDNIEYGILSTNHKISTLENEIMNMTLNLDQYSVLNKDLNKMNKAYDEMTFVKRSLSSKEGIPLYWMRMCLGNTEKTTNELLSIAYDGDIELAEFNITPTEFTIPFYNKGVLLSDVKLASQGELSFLSIALSFALSSQILSRYNIMLLDEIDGPLDTNNREKFIRILENQIDRIDGEQAFLITHNSMFSSYPVDIIDLSFRNSNDKYPLANYIEIIRE